MNLALEDVQHIFRHQLDGSELIFRVFENGHCLTVSVPRKDIATLIPSLSSWQYIGTDAAGVPAFESIKSAY
jgi:hypothetical protein